MIVLEILVVLYILPLLVILTLFGVAPFVAKTLSNIPFYEVRDKDGNPKVIPGHAGFFTTLQPGQVKIIERGERFVKCIMRWPGYTFAYIKDPKIKKEEDKWAVKPSTNTQKKEEDKSEVDDTGDKARDAYPVPKVSEGMKSWWLIPKIPFLPQIILWRLWKQYMYRFFGYVFTGIPPFQTVRTYPIEYFEEGTSSDGQYVLKRRSNRSDHYRVAVFYYPFPMDSADTANMIPAELAVGLTTQTVNPYSLAYKTDKAWASRYVSIARSVVNDQTRVRAIEEIVGSSGSKDVKEELSEIYKDIKESIEKEIKDFGLKLLSVNTPSRKTADPAAIKQLGAPGFAAAAGKARVIEAEKEAEALALVAAAINNAGASGDLAAQIEGRIRTVSSAGDRAIVSIGDGGAKNETDRMLKAILAELRKGGDGNA